MPKQNNAKLTIMYVNMLIQVACNELISQVKQQSSFRVRNLLNWRMVHWYTSL